MLCVLLVTPRLWLLLLLHLSLLRELLCRLLWHLLRLLLMLCGGAMQNIRDIQRLRGQLLG